MASNHEVPENREAFESSPRPSLPKLFTFPIIRRLLSQFFESGNGKPDYRSRPKTLTVKFSLPARGRQAFRTNFNESVFFVVHLLHPLPFVVSRSDSSLRRLDDRDVRLSLCARLKFSAAHLREHTFRSFGMGFRQMGQGVIVPPTASSTPASRLGEPGHCRWLSGGWRDGCFLS